MNCILLNSGHILEIILYIFSFTSNKLSAVDFKAFHCVACCFVLWWCLSQFLISLALMCICTLHYFSTSRIHVNYVVFGGIKFYIPWTLSSENVNVFLAILLKVWINFIHIFCSLPVFLVQLLLRLSLCSVLLGTRWCFLTTCHFFNCLISSWSSWMAISFIICSSIFSVSKWLTLHTGEN